MADDHAATDDALLSPDDARERLGLTADEFGEAIHEGELRRVTYAGEPFILGADVAKYESAHSPRKLARNVPRR